MDMKPPKPKLKKSDAVLQSLFENSKSPLAGPFLRWKLWKRWSEFVGPSIAQVTEPVSLHRGVLHVWVKNAVWMQQLVFMREQMTVTLNQKLGENVIEAIQLTMDRRSVPMDPEEKRRLQQAVAGLMKPEGFDQNQD